MRDCVQNVEIVNFISFIFQGFVVMGVKSSEPVMVCAACARSMRANTRLRKLEKNTEFICAVGLAPQRGVKMIGCFQCLSGKVTPFNNQ